MISRGLSVPTSLEYSSTLLPRPSTKAVSRRRTRAFATTIAALGNYVRKSMKSQIMKS
jgi:hypothetical protein